MVDAAQRQLTAVGWVPQAVRMVTASFLVEYLRVNWVEGLKHFHDQLTDADAAINSMMWQNAGRSGVDQWNFVMSPENASQDPSGAYVREWVPELSKLSNKYARPRLICRVDAAATTCVGAHTLNIHAVAAASRRAIGTSTGPGPHRRPR